ncbi:DUF3592 domain-containing protein [Duganella sp. Root1480D1]|uniref:DUF3592 domain-containing protein n=1 Tax=Duganella sp. Root1480D1 TaxID=1736471 RepID=UPI00070A2634|nr:DUF3592 domain-containing protein [Duganella sp. Root1480D1]KQZ39728.1 hypothetical protein ASD58_04870 [Duganella sp. Root1480D1]
MHRPFVTAAASPGLHRRLRRAAWYVLPLGLYALLCWEICGADMWALPRMVPVQGVLDKAETGGKAATSSRATTTVTVSYRYAVAGQQYRGENMICCGVQSSGLDPLFEMREQLRPLLGRSLTVWVDPRNPQRAVLFRYIPNSALLLMGFGLLLGIGGLRKLDPDLC